MLGYQISKFFSWGIAQVEQQFLTDIHLPSGIYRCACNTLKTIGLGMHLLFVVHIYDVCFLISIACSYICCMCFLHQVFSHIYTLYMYYEKNNRSSNYILCQELTCDFLSLPPIWIFQAHRNPCSQSRHLLPWIRKWADLMRILTHIARWNERLCMMNPSVYPTTAVFPGRGTVANT